MIKVYFPPGCYGTYFSRCLYNYTNLREGPFVEFGVDQNGSSHQHRNNLHAQSVIRSGHIWQFDFDDNDQVVAIVPCLEHTLDYYNNQFFKQQHGNLIEYILSQMSLEEAECKLKNQWQYDGKFDKSVPVWIMREWCSFWIDDILNISYNPLTYLNLNSVAQVTTQDIFENWLETFVAVVESLELAISVDNDIIQAHHIDFLNAQKFYNSQRRCKQYVQDVIHGNDNTMVIQSIFDEAYIQNLLRQHNFELQCNDLNIFPTTTQELRHIIYEISNHNN